MQFYVSNFFTDKLKVMKNMFALVQFHDNFLNIFQLKSQ